MFDEEGFYSIGDAGVFVDDNDPLQGIIFAGRVVEDFKLTTGTFVHVGSLRTDAIRCRDAGGARRAGRGAGSPIYRPAGLAQPARPAGRMVGNPDATFEDVVEASRGDRLPEEAGWKRTNASLHGGSSMRIARAMLMAEPPSIDGNELTDKGYINQRAGLERRAALVAKLYADQPGEDVIILN